MTESAKLFKNMHKSEMYTIAIMSQIYKWLPKETKGSIIDFEGNYDGSVEQ